VLTLSACGSNTPPAAETASAVPAASPAAATTAAANAPAPAATAPAKEAGAQQGGQVVEAGDYHLELIAAPEGENVRIDFWLMTGSDHASISNAKVTANILFPDGTQKDVEMTYDAAAQHYKALVPEFAPGEYRVVVQTDRQGEKVNGRFNFKL
jgi:hypothetical protein